LNKSYIAVEESNSEGVQATLVKDEVRYQNVLLSRVQPVIFQLLKTSKDFEKSSQENLF